MAYIKNLIADLCPSDYSPEEYHREAARIIRQHTEYFRQHQLRTKQQAEQARKSK